MPYMKEPSLHLSDEPGVLFYRGNAIKENVATSYVVDIKPVINCKKRNAYKILLTVIVHSN